MNRIKRYFSLFLVLLTLCFAANLSASALTYYDLVTDSKASADFDDDKVNAGVDKTQRKSTDYKEYRNYDDVDEQTVIVSATQHTTYTAKVPAILIVDGAFRPNDTNDFSFEVSVEGNLSGDALVRLQPDNSFTLSSFGKEDIPASITQEKTKFTYADGVRIDTPVVSSGIGNVQNMTAGLWYGTWNYNIRFLPIVDYDCYTWANDDFTTGQVTGITDIGKDKLETFGIMLFPEPNATDNFEGVSSISSEATTLMREIERTDCDIVIPNTVERIEDSTLGNSPFNFAKANKLIFEKPAKIKYLGNYAFTCAKIKEPIEIPASVEEIGLLALAEINGYQMNARTAVTFIFEEPSNLKTIGKEAFRYCNVTGKLVLPEGLKTIGESAFAYCSYTEIVLPDSIETIGQLAFEKRLNNGVTPIIKLNFPKNLVNWNGAFSYSTIQTMVLPDSITEIPDNAFKSCYNLKNFNIPNGVTSIGNRAFANCTSLTSISIPDSVTHIGAIAFDYCPITTLVIPDSVTSIGYATTPVDPIGTCKELTSLTIGKNVDLNNVVLEEKIKLSELNLNGLQLIGKNTFTKCKAIKTLTIKKGLTSVGADAFKGCPITKVNYTGSIEDWMRIDFESTYSDPTLYSRDLYINNSPVSTLTIPNWIDHIGSYDNVHGHNFSWRALTRVEIENGISEIGKSAFSGCKNLKSINIPNSVSNIGVNAFSGCSLLESITLPNSLSTISKETFYGAGLKSVVIPEGVTSIGEYAFYGNNKLITLVLPDTLKEIGQRAFADCTVINSIVIPNSVETIGDYAFNRYEKAISVDNFAGSISGAPWGARKSINWLREAE